MSAHICAQKNNTKKEGVQQKMFVASATSPMSPVARFGVGVPIPTKCKAKNHQ